MKFHRSGASMFIPDGLPETQAIERTTHLCVAAHQDDVEIMGFHGILECYGRPDRWFAAATVTDGSGSPRAGIYGRYSDSDMQRVRKEEQRKAAIVGEYAAMALLDYPSSVVKDPGRVEVAADIRTILAAARPEVVYTHNPADKHDTHIAVTLRTLQAIRDLPAQSRPRAVYGCEVWRDLDWLVDEDKIAFDVSGHENLAAALVGVFDSQIAGGKRYDLATLGRRRAHATYHASHETDDATALSFAMNLTPLIEDTELDVEHYVTDHVRRLLDDVSARLRKFSR